jgi:HSP20 family protein
MSSVLVKEKRKTSPAISTGLYDQTTLYGNVYTTPDTWNAGIETRIPRVNVLETSSSYVLEVAVPGLEKTDINLSVTNETLTISCEKETEPERDEKDTYRRKEFSYQTFSRAFQLPENVLSDKINATYSNGVLTITIPKSDGTTGKSAKEISVR